MASSYYMRCCTKCDRPVTIPLRGIDLKYQCGACGQEHGPCLVLESGLALTVEADGHTGRVETPKRPVAHEMAPGWSSRAVMRALNAGWAWRLEHPPPDGQFVPMKILVSPAEQNDPNHFKRYKVPTGQERESPSAVMNLPASFFDKPGGH